MATKELGKCPVCQGPALVGLTRTESEFSFYCRSGLHRGFVDRSEAATVALTEAMAPVTMENSVPPDWDKGNSWECLDCGGEVFWNFAFGDFAKEHYDQTHHRMTNQAIATH